MTETGQPAATGDTLSYEPATPAVAVHGLTVVLLVAIFASVLSFAMWGMGYGLMSDEWAKYGAGAGIPLWEARAASVCLQIARVAVPASMALVAVLLLMWVNRANRKLRSLGAPVRITPFRAVILWIIPYRCLIAPLYIVKEIYAVSRGISVRTFTPLVGCWWALWLLANLTYLVAITAGNKRSEGEDDAQFAADWAIWHMLPAPLYIVSGLLLMGIVWRVDRALQRRTLPRAA